METWMIIAIIVAAFLIITGGSVATYNWGFGSCEDDLNSTIEEYDQKNTALTRWENELENKEISLNDTVNQIDNYTAALDKCRKALDTPTEYPVLFWNFKYTYNDIKTIIFVTIYSFVMSLVFPISLSLVKVKIKISKGIGYGFLISFILLFAIVIILGAK